MPRAAALLLLLPSFATADPEPIIDLKSIVPRMQTHGEDMVGGESVAPTIIASSGRRGGRLRAARAFIDDSQAYIGLVTRRGFQSFPVDGVVSNGDFVTLEELVWKDVVGDAEPELWAQIATYHDPCACDDGPTSGHTYVVICRANGNGAQCSPPIEVGMQEDFDEERWFSGELKLQTEPDGRVFGRVGIRAANNLTRSQRARIKRPQRVF